MSPALLDLLLISPPPISSSRLLRARHSSSSSASYSLARLSALLHPLVLYLREMNPKYRTAILFWSYLFTPKAKGLRLSQGQLFFIFLSLDRILVTTLVRPCINELLASTVEDLLGFFSPQPDISLEEAGHLPSWPLHSSNKILVSQVIS